MGLERVADDVVNLIDRLIRLVPELRDREVSAGRCLDTLQEDLGSLELNLFWETDLYIASSLKRESPDRLFLAGVKVDAEGRVRFDDQWVHELFRLRQVVAGYAHRRLRQPNWNPERIVAAITRTSGQLNENGGQDPTYVTLDMAASIVNRSKKTLERHLAVPNSGMPLPDVKGGGGKPHEWLWSRLRPWLQSQFRRQLPELFPGHIRRVR